MHPSFIPERMETIHFATEKFNWSPRENEMADAVGCKIIACRVKRKTKKKKCWMPFRPEIRVWRLAAKRQTIWTESFFFWGRLFMASVAVSLLVSCLPFLLWRPYRRHWYSRCHYLSPTIAADPSLTSGRLAPPPSIRISNQTAAKNANDQLINCTPQSVNFMFHRADLKAIGSFEFVQF